MASTTAGSTTANRERATVSERIEPLVRTLLGGVPVRLSFWDGSALEPDVASVGPCDSKVIVRSPDALRRMLWAPGELGVARAFVTGEIDVEGDVFDLVEQLRPAGRRLHGSTMLRMPALLRAAIALGAFGPPLPAPAEEARPHGRVHSLRRDRDSVTHHYDVGNDFYRLVLGPSMTYSCARFATPDTTLEEAQSAKHELISRKLGLAERPGSRLLDVGCGWGSMAIHAAAHHGASVLGMTLSGEQADLARRRVEEAGLGDRVEIRVQDYRTLGDERFDAISSIGMFEHVGSSKLAEYTSRLHAHLRPGGRLLNHAISSVGGSPLRGNTFVGRYVFPDGELVDVGEVVLGMEAAGFEVRDVESLREHYASTLRHWVRNLQQHWDEAVELVGEARARIWLLYMAASAVGFEDGGVAVHQVLGVATDEDGSSGMPRTRRAWEGLMV